MNDDHEHARTILIDMIDLANDRTAAPSEMAKLCRAFFEHNQAHFGREEAAMKAAAFPPYPMHKNEHDRALEQLEKLACQAEQGSLNQEQLKTIREDLPSWYLRHIQTMDAVTARWIADKSG